MATKPPQKPHFLREWRVARGLRQEDLAKMVGTIKTVISRYERSERGISLEMQWKLFEALDVTPTQFFLGPGEPDLNVIAKDQSLEVRRLLEKVLKDWIKASKADPGT